MFKTCCRCKTNKPSSDFGKYKASKDGLRFMCKLCRKQDRIDHLEHDKLIDKKYRDKNKIKRCEKSKIYYQNNKYKKKEYDRKRYLETQGKNRIRRDDWLAQRSEKVKEKQKVRQQAKQEKKLKQEWIVNQIKELSDKGIGSRKIAKQLGIDRSTVIRYYRVLGLETVNKKTLKTVPFQTEKNCKTCQIVKPVSEFRKRICDTRFGYEPYCYSCEYKKNLDRLNGQIKWKLKNDPSYKLRKNISYAVWEALKKNASSKQNESILKYLPYTIDQLKQHLERQFEWWMSWDNWGIYDAKSWDDSDSSTWKWQIDHIIPQSMLRYNHMSEDNFQRCWALNNLRPLSAKKNILDGVTRIRHNNE